MEKKSGIALAPIDLFIAWGFTVAFVALFSG